jgi:hypothetical protein
MMTTRYTCGACGGTFSTSPSWTDDQARAEALARFGKMDPTMAVVCDDCYRDILKWLATDEGKELTMDTDADEDARLLEEIHATDNPSELASRIYAFYRDGDRADRTSRAQMYLHMGMLAGTIMKLVEQQKVTGANRLR